jgi:hypothetical protein
MLYWSRRSYGDFCIFFADSIPVVQTGEGFLGRHRLRDGFGHVFLEAH